VTTPPPDSARAEGVFYAPADYAGFWRRLLSGLVDAVAVFAAVVVVWFALSLARGVGPSPLAMTLVWFVLGYAYLVALKRSWLRTLGYRLAGIRVVDLRGGPPSLARMTLRSTFLVFGPGFAVFDLVWLRSNADRQKIADMVSGTYVIRAGARPCGGGQVVVAFWDVMCHFVVCPQVRRAAR
jgi:uncharacterized RDD family membrane protein YckC